MYDESKTLKKYKKGTEIIKKMNVIDDETDNEKLKKKKTF